MKTHPKFIQIVCSSTSAGSPISGIERREYLYGLTEDGRVFEWNGQREGWVEMGGLETLNNNA